MAVNDFDHFRTIRTTVTLPAWLVERSQRYIEQGLLPSRNALLVAALEHFLELLDAREIDRQFAAMADDDAYRAFSVQTTEAFAESDWEALELEELEEADDS